MKHEPTGGPEWEPEWLKEMRKIEATIARHVDVYIKARRWMTLWVGFASMTGYWFGWGVTELLRYWLSLK